MNQPDSMNVQTPVEAIGGIEQNSDALDVTYQGREWFPEDEDEWYEPDYAKGEGRKS